MFVTFEEYTDFGFDAIPEEKFGRYIFKAGSMVEKWTLNRVTNAVLEAGDDDIVDDDIAGLIERNKRGICEIAELIFRQERPVVGELGVPIKSFSNEGYSETLSNTAVADSAMLFEREAMNILDVYFTREQLYRGGGM